MWGFLITPLTTSPDLVNRLTSESTPSKGNFCMPQVIINDEVLNFQVFETLEEIYQGSIIGKTESLGVDSWTFPDLYKAHLNNIYHADYCINKMIIGSIQDKPITCALVFTAWGMKNSGCYVKPFFRLQGHGKSTMNYLKQIDKQALRVHSGIEGSMTFWNKIGASEFGFINDT